MIIHFFTKGNARLGDSRQRAFRVAEELNIRGVSAVIHEPPVMDISITPWPKKWSLILATIRSLFQIKKGDIIFLQRTIGNKYFFVIMVLYVKLFQRKMIFDFDDAIYTHDFFKTKVLTHMADLVIVCSQALAEWARRYNHNVHTIHTPLKFSAYEKFTKKYEVDSKPVIIGWVGTAKDHFKNLEFFASILETLVQNTPVSFKFVLIGAGQHKAVYDLFERIPHVQTQFVDSLEWDNPESVPREIQKFDIGVMPLVGENVWNLSRSSFKPLEYMACGVATISSAIGEITHVIQNGMNGYLAYSKDEWVDALQKLLSNVELRSQIGHAGQLYLRENDCYEVVIPRMITLINSVEQN